MNDWTAFGRVDADGTVYVKTAEGDRVVGSWQAGTPEEGLAHFARRFADLVTEVDLIEARLKSGAADAAHSLTSVKRIRASLDEAHVVGDIDGLAARLDRLTAVADEKAGEAKAAREVARGEALARKTALVEEAETIAAESTGWKSAGDRLKEILDEWKTIRGVDKKTDGELWKRFAAARDGFTRRRGAHFASLDSQRKVASGQKEQLVAEAESLTDSTDASASTMLATASSPSPSAEIPTEVWKLAADSADTRGSSGRTRSSSIRAPCRSSALVRQTASAMPSSRSSSEVSSGSARSSATAARRSSTRLSRASARAAATRSGRRSRRA